MSYHRHMRFGPQATDHLRRAAESKARLGVALLTNCHLCGRELIQHQCALCPVCVAKMRAMDFSTPVGPPNNG